MKQGEAAGLGTRGTWLTLLLILSGFVAMHGLSATHGPSVAASPGSVFASSPTGHAAAHPVAPSVVHGSGEPLASLGRALGAAAGPVTAGYAAFAEAGSLDTVAAAPALHVEPLESSSLQVLSADVSAMGDHGSGHLMVIGCLLALAGGSVTLGVFAAARLLRTPWSMWLSGLSGATLSPPGVAVVGHGPWWRPRISLCVLRV